MKLHDLSEGRGLDLLAVLSQGAPPARPSVGSIWESLRTRSHGSIATASALTGTAAESASQPCGCELRLRLLFGSRNEDEAKLQDEVQKLRQNEQRLQKVSKSAAARLIKVTKLLCDRNKPCRLPCFACDQSPSLRSQSHHSSKAGESRQPQSLTGWTRRRQKKAAKISLPKLQL
ncbi:uncharacterized protein LOC144994152 [Oryzias latipes]